MLSVEQKQLEGQLGFSCTQDTVLNQEIGYLRGVKIFLTYDYELFFGDIAGSVEKCMLEPTNDLLKLAEGKNVFYTFFVDVGYLVQAQKYPELKEELNEVKSQLERIVHLGHDIQLHIHPHWEKAQYVNGAWKMNTKGNYKLSDFDQHDSNAIVRNYKLLLEDIIGRKVQAFRAGGWCIQPFEHLKEVFVEQGLKIDSSVIVGDYFLTDDYYVDFRSAPLKSKYNFEDDVCLEVEQGSFTEYPISSLRYNPIFYWKLYALGRLKPKSHKMIGDGVFLSQGGRKKRVLTSYSNAHVSSDGYYAKKLEAGLNKAINLDHQEMVVIGHPKGNTLYSLKKLKSFIDRNHNQHNFTTFNREL